MKLTWLLPTPSPTRREHLQLAGRGGALLLGLSPIPPLLDEARKVRWLAAPARICCADDAAATARGH
ncbi:hypothetical protein Dimus_014691 [Dionaea muscipula]